MDTYQLNEQQQRLAETFYNDYSLIKLMEKNIFILFAM
jgi:hypothetical protein